MRVRVDSVAVETQHDARRDADGRQWALRLAQAGWVVVTLLSIAFLVRSLGKFLSGSELFWLLDDGQISSQVVSDGLDQLGMSPRLYAAIGIAVIVGRASVSFLVGLLLFRRRTQETIALLVAFLIVAQPSGEADPRALHAMWADEPFWAAIGIAMDLIAFNLLMTLFLVFPDGRFTPRWTRLLAAAWIAMGVSTLLLPGSPLDLFTWPPAVFLGFIPLCAGLAIFAQVWRYRHTSGPLQRQQTKWFALGFTIVLADFAALVVLTEYALATWPTADPARIVLADLAIHTLHSVAIVAIPLTLVIAITRHRLWDLGILVNRALVYGSLTAALALLYLGLVVLFQELLQAVTGSGSDLAIAASTLATAALFRPLRGRFQRTIDRHFYRQRYDAARTVSAFGAALRDETDLQRIQTDLLTTVQEAMQPSHASLWLVPPQRLAAK